MKLSLMLFTTFLATPLAYANDADSKKVHAVIGDIGNQLRGISKATVAMTSDASVKEEPQNSEGSIWDRYEKLEKLGQGAFGTVYKAKDLETGMLVAVKEQDVSEMQELQFQMLENEINIMQYLRGLDNVVQFYEYDQEGAIVYLVMELLEGGDMWEHSEHLDESDEEYDEASARDIFWGLLGAVAALHSNGIVHHDIKPNNIAYKSKDSPMSEPIIIDYGTSQFCWSKTCDVNSGGTPVFSPPEFLKLAGSPFDVWSVGVLMYWSVVGDYPFPGEFESAGGITELYKMMNAGPSFDDLADEDEISDELKDLISQMLDPSPDSRPSALEALEHPWFKLDREILKSNVLKTAATRFSDPDHVQMLKEKAAVFQLKKSHLG